MRKLQEWEEKAGAIIRRIDERGEPFMRAFRQFDNALDFIMPAQSHIECAFWLLTLSLGVWYIVHDPMWWVFKVPLLAAIWVLFIRLFYRLSNLDRMQYPGVVRDAWLMYRDRQRRWRQRKRRRESGGTPNDPPQT